MNLTLYSLTTSSLLNSPMIFIPSMHSQLKKFRFSNIKLNYYFSNFFSANSNVHSTISKCLFINFIKPPISIESYIKRTCISFENFFETQGYSNTELCIDSCNFMNCKNLGHYAKGGAIYFMKLNSILKVHGCIFKECICNGDGGAIFAAAKVGDTNFQGSGSTSHENMESFYSHYCCYSECSAKIVESSKQGFSGYGSALFVASNSIELNYSSSVDCPSISESSFGAQFDMQTTNVKSCFINATKGNSVCCSAIEYRNAKKGFFSYQTIVNQIGGFISSFTKLEGEVNISCCNLVNNTIRYTNIVPTCAIIHVRLKSVTISDFVVIGTAFDGFNGLNQPLFASKGRDKSDEFFITVIGCHIESSFNNQNFFQDITTISNFFNEEGQIFQTNTILQLNLGDCQGTVKPPPIATTSQFSESFNFSESNRFSDTQDFSYNSPSQSIFFSNSHHFSASVAFSSHSTNSMLFSESVKFTETEKFSKSDIFSESRDFTKSDFFSYSDEFTLTNYFSPSHQFTESEKFSQSDEFSHSNFFSDTNKFTSTEPFTNTETFTKTAIFTQSKPFSKSSEFSMSSDFSETSEFTPSIIYPWIIISNPDDQKDKGVNSRLIGGVVGGAAGAGIAASVTFYLVKRKKMNRIEISISEASTASSNEIVMQNPIYGMNIEDDPFQNDFAEHLASLDANL